MIKNLPRLPRRAFFVLLFSLLPAMAVAQPPTTDDLDWISGSWIGQMGDGVIEEIWSPPAAGTLVGMFRWSTEEGVRLYELMSIEDGKDGPTLYLRHFSPGLQAWESKEAPMTLKLDAFAGHRVSFLEVTDRQTTRLTYERTDTGLEITLEQIEGAKKSSTTFVYQPR